MMAYHQRVNQFKSRIDFDDPSTTKPPSLAKSAVLQALEEEERQQQSRGKGFLQQSRPSRSRQREPVPGSDRALTPCINRDTVLRINRRPIRHRSCDSFWPPQQHHGSARSPSPRANLGGAEGGSFAYDTGAYGHYGSHESVYFDERVRKQHKIDPLRTMFDKANVVLVDWGGRNKVATPPAVSSERLSDNGVYDRRCQEKVVGDDDAGNNSGKQGEMIESEAKPPTPPVSDMAPLHPPSPPPRKYFLPMEQLQSGVGIEILLRCYGGPPPTSSLNQSESQEISTFKIDDGTDSRQRAKQQQPLPPTFPAFTEDRTLYQDGIQSKPPLKSRATPTKRFPSKPTTPTPTIGPVNHSDDPSMTTTTTTTNRDEFNINSNTILNLNIDNTLPSTTVPQITVTDCPELRGATSKTNDQLWHEIIDENHNYNDKLITNSSSPPQTGVAEFGIDGPPQSRPQLPNEQHSKLNVSNQANRNWINLNSNEIYPHSAGADWAAPPAAARVTKTRVRSDSLPEQDHTLPANDGLHRQQQQPVLTVIRNPVDNYDNKSIKSNYWTNQEDQDDQDFRQQLRRSQSRDSSRSWRVDEVLEFPPPPPYLCDCDESSSGRCSAEQGLSRAQSHDNRARSTPVVPSRASSTGDNPTISQSCRQDSTADVCPSFGGRWDDNHTRVAAAAAAAADDDYFKTNLTDDKFLNEYVNTACNLRQGQSKHRQQSCCSSPGSDHQPGQASDSLHKSIDAFLAHERGQAGSKNSVPGAMADQNTHQMSFTDGEYIFGPYDQHSEEFQHFNLWSSEFRKLRRNCHHQQQLGGGGARSDSSSGTTLVPPQATSHDGGSNSSCSCSAISSSDTLRDDPPENELAKTPEWRQHQPQPSKQVENYDDIPENVPASGNVPPATTSDHRWVRFENGNTRPRSPTPLIRVPTPYPSPTREDEDIVDRFAEQLKGSRSWDQESESVGPVENVPLIDAVLDDLLTFSKSLTADEAAGEGRAAAKIVEINDDNLINLLADDDNAASGAGRVETGANEDFSSATTGKKDSAGLEKSLPSKLLLGSANSDDVVEGEKCDQNANEARNRCDVSEDNYLKREDIFANVAIFSWNPLDVYQHHGLFMIDPRFALADLHATTGCNAADANQKTNDAHPGNDGDDTAAATATSIGMQALTDGADPSSADVNSFATQRAQQDGILLLESHKIPNDSPTKTTTTTRTRTRTSPGTTVDHFYDSAHVEYPVRRPDLSLSNATKECHQSPPQPLVESDYDNDLAKKCNPQQDTGDGEEGLKRVAWPPSAEGGDEYEQVQQQQQPQQQQQQYYQQPQQHQVPAFQQYQQPAQQQQQPRERIIPIQRPEQQQQQHQQQQYQPQPTQAFQPLVAQPQQQQFYQPEQQQQQLHQHQPEPVPFFTTLRSEPPMSQEPAPVYQTQPVAAIYQGGSNMRGDQKWPPAEVKKQSELENEERRRLAQEPAFRPRKVQKDYGNFFAKNALNQTYPGYRAPPGTQHHS